MTSALINRGFAVNGEARQFEYSDFEEFDLILAMDKENYHNILSLDRQHIYGDKVKLMCDFAQNYSTKEVPDPYYGGQKGFENVIDLLTDSCQGLLIYVKKQLKLN
jgi:protein-tyrosine phosphatase